MARFDAGSINIDTAGTQERISNTPNKVRRIYLHARAGNVGPVYFGASDVSSTNGWELNPGDEKMFDFDVPVTFDELWVDAANNNDDIDFVVVLDPR